MEIKIFFSIFITMLILARRWRVSIVLAIELIHFNMKTNSIPFCAYLEESKVSIQMDLS